MTNDTKCGVSKSIQDSEHTLIEHNERVLELRRSPLRARVVQVTHNHVHFRWMRDNARQDVPNARPELRLHVDDVHGDISVGTTGLLYKSPKTNIPQKGLLGPIGENYRWTFVEESLTHKFDDTGNRKGPQKRASKRRAETRAQD